MNKIYAFDIDGTLTPSRLRIDQDFEEFFYEWMQDKKIVFITGSDAPKTIEQIGMRIWNSADVCMQSCGNQIFEKGKETYKIDWEPSRELVSFLEELLQETDYSVKTSNHIEHRTGLLNFSIVGRDCTQEQRDAYYKWDTTIGERLEFAEKIMDEFPDIEASVGGQISIDIHPKGANKGQAKEWLLNKYGKDIEINFFGDKMEKGGNDYDLAVLLEDGHNLYPVLGWKDTSLILKIID